MLAAAGVPVALSDVFGAEGSKLLDRIALATTQRARLDSARRLIDMLEFEIDTFTRLAQGRLHRDQGYLAVQTIPGIGPILAAVLVAEIGDVTRFDRPEQLTSWAGLTPRHRESDTTVHRGKITKQGSRLVRWAAVESVQRVHPSTQIGARRDRVAARRGRNIGAVAAARAQLELVFYALRDQARSAVTAAQQPEVPTLALRPALYSPSPAERAQRPSEGYTPLCDAVGVAANGRGSLAASDSAGLVGPHGDLDTVSGAQFSHEAGEVGFDGAWGDVELAGDLVVGAALG